MINYLSIILGLLRMVPISQNNLGNAFSTLAEVENKRENCKKAITAYQEALNVFNEEEFPEIFHIVSANMKRALEFLGK